MNDGALVRRARRGDQSAAAVLFGRHWLAAWRIAFALTGDRASADDVAQVALVRAFANLASFDPSRPFAPWLHRIVTRAALDAHRNAAPSVPYGLDVGDGRPENDDLGDLGERVEHAVLCLEQNRRIVVVLRYWGDLGIDEIALLLDLPAGTVASRLSRGLADVRATIEEGSHARRGT